MEGEHWLQGSCSPFSSILEMLHLFLWLFLPWCLGSCVCCYQQGHGTYREHQPMSLLSSWPSRFIWGLQGHSWLFVAYCSLGLLVLPFYISKPAVPDSSELSLECGVRRALSRTLWPGGCLKCFLSCLSIYALQEHVKMKKIFQVMNAPGSLVSQTLSLATGLYLSP